MSWLQLETIVSLEIASYVKTQLTQAARWVRHTAAALLKQALVVYCAGTDLRLTRRLRYLAIAVAAYAFSPIDLIPDFIPVLGLLDDIILVPAGVSLVLHRAPREVIISARKRAEEILHKPVNLVSGLVIVIIWVVVSGVLLNIVWLKVFSPSAL